MARTKVYCSVWFSGFDTRAYVFRKEGDRIIPIAPWDSLAEKSLPHQINAWACPENPYPHEMNDPILKQGLGLKLFVVNKTEPDQEPWNHPFKAFLPKGGSIELVGKLEWEAIHLQWVDMCSKGLIDFSEISRGRALKEACETAFQGNPSDIKPGIAAFLMGIAHAPSPSFADLLNG